MKRILIATVSLLVLVAVFFLLRKNLNKTGTESHELFRLENPQAIDKVLLAPNNPKLPYLIIYKEKSGQWFVKNDRLNEPADTHSIRELLFWVMKKSTIKTPVSEAEKEPVTREIALNGIKAVFYEGDKEINTIYVGNPTPNQEATYMYNPEMERPAIIEIAGFKGYLTPYFTLDFDAWRSPVVLDFTAEQIKTLKATWPAAPQEGFMIEQNADGVYLTNHTGKKLPEVNQTRLLSFLERFQNVAREYGETAGINKKPALRDSVLKQGPFFILSITDSRGIKKEIKLYRMQISGESYAQQLRDGSIPDFETETYWLQISGKPELWIVQGAVMKSRMKTLGDFVKTADPAK
jgi:hypothetical protein